MPILIGKFYAVVFFNKDFGMVEFDVVLYYGDIQYKVARFLLSNRNWAI